jgi:hypothetical protein
MTSAGMWFPKQHDSISKPRNLFSKFTVCGFETTCWALCGVETTRVCGIEICCFYLTGQLESILRKFQLAGVVLVVSKPHVFNLTGQLVLKPPKFPTLAATESRSAFVWYGVHGGKFGKRRRYQFRLVELTCRALGTDQNSTPYIIRREG